LRSNDRYAGRRVKCPDCGTINRLPSRPGGSAPARDTPSDARPETCRLCGHDFSADPDRVKDAKGQHYHRSCYRAEHQRRSARAAAAPDLGQPLTSTDLWDEFDVEHPQQQPAEPLTTLRSHPAPGQPDYRLRWMLGIGVSVPVVLLIFILGSLAMRGGDEPSPPRASVDGATTTADWSDNATTPTSVSPKPEIASHRRSSLPPPPPPPSPRPPQFPIPELPNDDGSEAFNMLKFGVRQLNQGDFDFAIAAFSKVIELNPRLAVFAYHGRYTAYFENGEYDKAIADATKLLRLSPGQSASLHFIRAVAHHYNGDHGKAIADYTEAILLEPTLAEAYAARAATYSKMGLNERAHADCTEAIRLDPTVAIAYFSRAMTYFKKEEDGNAISDFNEAIRLDPTLVHAYIGRGVAYSRMSKYDMAIADYTEAIRLDPTGATPFAARAEAYHEKGDFDNSIGDWSEAIRLDPKTAPMAHTGRGHAYACSGDLDKASADWTEAIRLAEVPLAYNRLARLHATCPVERHRDGERAVELAVLACRAIEWGHPDYLDTLAAAYAEIGDFDLAVKWQTKALDMGRDDEEMAARLRARLELYQAGKPCREDPRTRNGRGPGVG